MERIFEQKQAIAEYETEWPLEVSLTSAQWRLIAKVIDVLAVFKSATLRISESNSLLSEVLPTVKSIEKSIRLACSSDDVGVKNLKQQLLNSLCRRFEEHTEDENLLLATITDPRFKTTGLKGEETQNVARQLLRQKIRQKMENRLRTVHPTPIKRRRSSQPMSPSKKLQLWANLSDSESDEEQLNELSSECEATILPTAPSQPLIPEARVEEAVESFLNEDRIETDPFNYWKTGSQAHPDIYSIAKEVMSCPSGSVESERLFSVAGELLNVKRTSMSANSFEDQLFLAKNLPFFEYDY